MVAMRDDALVHFVRPEILKKLKTTYNSLGIAELTTQHA